MEQKHHIVILLAESLLTWCLYTESICDCKPVHVVYVYISLSLPCFPDFRGKGGYTSLPPGGRPSSTILYPGPPSSSPRPPTPPFSCLSRCNRAISYVVFLSFSFPSPGEHMPSLVVDPLSFVLHVLPTSSDSSPIYSTCIYYICIFFIPGLSRHLGSPV